MKEVIFMSGRRRSITNVSILALLFILNLILLKGIDALTLDSESRDGNGNIAYVLWAPAVLALVAFCIQLCRLVHFFLGSKKVKYALRTAIAGFVVIVFSSVMDVLYIRSEYKKLSELEHITPQHTNTLYFNGWAFLLCIGVSIFTMGILFIIKSSPRSNSH